jgi:hypothetical protein
MAEYMVKGEIYEKLQEIRYCSLANLTEDKTIEMRVMTFTCTEDLKHFYMLSPRTAKKVKEFIDNRSATLLAYTLTKNLEDFVQIVARGKMRIHIEAHTPDLIDAIQILGEKMDLPAEKYKDGIPGDSIFLELRPDELCVTTYRDILNKNPVTKIIP